MGHVWNDETTEIVRCNWGEKNPAQIAAIVNNYLKKSALNAGKKSWGITSPRGGGVVWKAVELGLISVEEQEAWYKKEKKRKQKERSKITKNVRQLVIERDGGRCLRCGSKSKLQIDHINPLFQNGATVLNNLQTLCQKCNLKKGVTTADYRPRCVKCASYDVAGTFVIIIDFGKMKKISADYYCAHCLPTKEKIEAETNRPGLVYFADGANKFDELERVARALELSDIEISLVPRQIPIKSYSIRETKGGKLKRRKPKPRRK